MKYNKQDRRRKRSRKENRFWNIAGISNKHEETWRHLEEFNVLYLIETWLTDGV